MKTVTKVVYEFDELTDKAKENARDWMRTFALDYGWWDSTYEDAQQIGLKITGFDLDRSRHAEGSLIEPLSVVCQKIVANHGKACGTYKLAEDYFRCHHAGATFDKEEFTKALLEEYSIMLQQECEYRLSDEAIDEDIRGNAYTFTADGKREG